MNKRDDFCTQVVIYVVVLGDIIMNSSMALTIDESDTATDLLGDMVSAGKRTVEEVYGSWIIYRRLEPLTNQLAGLRKAGSKMEIDADRIPRKHEEDYARASMWFINESRRIQSKKAPIQELLFIGDSLYTDGTAFQNLIALSNWKGSCFIGHDDPASKATSEVHAQQGLYLANRWSALLSWIRWTLERGFLLNEVTAVIVDIDKTLLGAKGRNDHVIDSARLHGIYRTMDAVLGTNFDREAFERQYAELNKAEYHPITADNQDYLAYICLVLNANLLQLDELVGEVQKNRLDNFEQVTNWVNTRLMMNPTGGERLRQVHEAVMMAMHSGDPTPFKRFRQEEFLTTAERMGKLADSSSVDELLQDEITMTREVVDISEWLADRGCTLLCMSDKPDESACPPQHLAGEFLPLHQIATHCVGYNIQEHLRVL